MHLDYAILQNDPFKSKYDHVMRYLPDEHLFQSYIRRDDYTPSTISRRMNEFNDRILIHTVTPAPEPRSHARVYNDAYYILETNTPTPRTSYASSTMSYANPSITYTTPRTSHKIPKQRHRRNQN